MSQLPFKRFVITFLLFDKGIPYIVDKLKDFGYKVADTEVSDVFDEIRTTVPPSVSEILNSGQILNLENETHVEWLKHFGVYEFYDYIVNKGKVEANTKERPYFKWCSDCMWAHSHQDIMSLINIFLYNDEDLEEISKIVMFRYRKKIGADALELYRRMFWDTEGMNAKEAIHYCVPFRNNTLIVKKLRGGVTEITMPMEENDGSDVPFTFHDTDYIKWKIGYRDGFEVPSPTDFMRRVQEDSYFKYYETMNMTQSVEVEEEEGENDKLGEFNATRKRKRNVEEQRVKMAKHWLDVYLKAHASMPTGGQKNEDFFDKMEELELGYDEEKIMSIEDNQQILQEIAGDMNPVGENGPE